MLSFSFSFSSSCFQPAPEISEFEEENELRLRGKYSCGSSSSTYCSQEWSCTVVLSVRHSDVGLGWASRLSSVADITPILNLR
jgi:hypothetical protein